MVLIAELYCIRNCIVRKYPSMCCSKYRPYQAVEYKRADHIFRITTVIFRITTVIFRITTVIFRFTTVIFRITTVIFRFTTVIFRFRIMPVLGVNFNNMPKICQTIFFIKEDKSVDTPN